jgi:hypothetical protein
MGVILLEKKVNIVTMKSPHLHDLIHSPCVSNEVLKFNRQVEKKIKIYNNQNMLEQTRQKIFY